MFLQKNKSTKNSIASGKNSVPSVIADDMNILGNLISDGYIDINGHVEGNVKCNFLVVREKGRVKGDVITDSVQVFGEICGLIKARHVHLTPTARVRGVVMHESLTIDDGAFVDGQCKRTDRHIEDEQSSLSMDDDSNMEVLENFRVVHNEEK